MKRPSFQFYPQDFMADPNVIGMSNEEVGVYMKLLCLMWNTSDCSLKKNENYLAKITHSSNDVITTLLPCFKEKDGYLRHKRLDVERRKQDEYRKKCSQAGKKGMKKRWKHDNERYNGDITSHNSSTSSSTSSSKHDPKVTDKNTFNYPIKPKVRSMPKPLPQDFT